VQPLAGAFLVKYFPTFVAAAALLAAPLAMSQASAVAQTQTAAAVVQGDYDALFKQMFQNPSNLEISFKFAEQAAARGDYEAAIGALERMLFFNPNLPRVKLELGVMYFKLGSWDLARGYFQDAIVGAGVPDDIRAQVNAYLAEIARRQAPYEFSAFLHAGARWQSNANVGPDSTLIRAAGVPATLNNQFARAPDWNWFQLVAMQYIHKINKRGDAFEVIATGYASQQHKFTQFDLGLIEVTAGPRIAINQDASFKLYGIGTGVTLAHHKYIESWGAGFSIRGPLGSIGVAEGYVEHRNRRFFNSDEFPTAFLQTGNLLTSAILTELRFGVVKLTTRVGYDRNEAREQVFVDFFGNPVLTVHPNNYHRYSVDVGLPIEFSVPGFDGVARQVVITPTAGYSETRYADPDPLVDPDVRRLDKEARVGGIIDVQLYQNWGVRTTITQSWINSSLPNYEMKNFTVAFGPTARF
jgi:hypothetical protein